MSSAAWVEACGLPVLFLTVTLAAAIRPGAATTLVPPSPASMVAAMLLFAILVRSGAFAPQRLMSSSRTTLANLNGLTVHLAVFVASAQVITLVVPDSGLPALIVWAVLGSLLLQACAIAPDRRAVLRGLLVTFGVTFTLKFVILAAVSAPAESRLGQAFQVLFHGITLGAISQRPAHSSEAYLAFGTLMLYLVGIAWLPSAAWHMVRMELDDRSRRSFETIVRGDPSTSAVTNDRDEPPKTNHRNEPPYRTT